MFLSMSSAFGRSIAVAYANVSSWSFLTESDWPWFFSRGLRGFATSRCDSRCSGNVTIWSGFYWLGSLAENVVFERWHFSMLGYAPLSYASLDDRVASSLLTVSAPA